MAESRQFTGFRQKLTVALMELTFGIASPQVSRRVHGGRGAISSLSLLLSSLESSDTNVDEP